MNYRLRLALAADVGLAPARGMALLQRVMPGEWPVLTSGAFALALARLAHEVRPHDPATPVALPDPEREREACGLAWWLGGSTGSGAPAVLRWSPAPAVSLSKACAT